MSGRSAYVRERTRHTTAPAPPQNLVQTYNNQISYAMPTSFVPVTLSPLQPSFPALSQQLGQKAGHHHPRQSSFSTDSSENGPSQRPVASLSRPTPSIHSSGIEKSSFRTMMDRQSDKIRNTLAGKKSAAKAAQSRPSTRDTPSGSSLAQYPPSPAPIKAHMIRNNEGLGVGYEGHHQAPEIQMNPVEQQPTFVHRWAGGGRGSHPWNKLRRDPELWDPSGDTLVYFGHETQQSTRPQAAFRVPSYILEETGSTFLVTILREGYRYNDEYDLPPSPTSPPALDTPSSLPHARVPPARSARSGYSNSEYALRFRSGTTVSTTSHAAPSNNHMARRGRQPTPPHSIHSLGTTPDNEAPVMHEIYFPAPSNLSQTDLLRHHLTTRNLFALLLNKSLVGLTLYQALLDLHERLDMYMPPDSDNSGLIINYLRSKGLDDVRNDPATAASLLAYSEGASVRWEDGWREAFVHCAGMQSRLTEYPEYRDISPISRALLDRANLEVQVRLQQAEDRLSTFDFADMWPVSSMNPPGAKASFDRFRKFLLKFYASIHFAWPPPLSKGHDNQDQSRRLQGTHQAGPDRGNWLTRDLARRLQRDFAALYDYIVNRDIVWDESENRPERKWNLISLGANPDFRADRNDLPFTDILVGFDNRHRYPHIPHPFPLVPSSFPVQLAKPPAGLFGNKKAKVVDSKVGERMAALSYSEATNIEILGSDFVANELVEAFANFEKTDQIGEVDPFDARKGRWLLLYGILQSIATVSVDTPNLRFTNDVPYFINPRLRGTPPWKDRRDYVEEEIHLHSHCWTVRRTWLPELSSEPPETRHTEDMVSVPDRYGSIADASLLPPPKRIQALGSEIGEISGDERATEWVNSGGGYQGGNDTLARGSQREKVRDWPAPKGIACKPLGVRRGREQDRLQEYAEDHEQEYMPERALGRGQDYMSERALGRGQEHMSEVGPPGRGQQYIPERGLARGYPGIEQREGEAGQEFFPERTQGHGEERVQGYAPEPEQARTPERMQQQQGQQHAQEHVPIQQRAQELMPSEQRAQELMPGQQRTREQMPIQRRIQEQMPIQQRFQEHTHIQQQWSQEPIPLQQRTQEPMPIQQRAQEHIPIPERSLGRMQERGPDRYKELPQDRPMGRPHNSAANRGMGGQDRWAGRAEYGSDGQF